MKIIISFTNYSIGCLRGVPLITYPPRGGRGGQSLLYISIVYYMRKGGEGVHIACKNAYVINGRPLKLTVISFTGYSGTLQLHGRNIFTTILWKPRI